MRTTSALIMGAAALLQLSGFASAETCDSYEVNGVNTLCGDANGALDPYPDACAADANGDFFTCTAAECCETETCADYDDGTGNANSLCGAIGTPDNNSGGDPYPACEDEYACDFEDCCVQETCNNGKYGSLCPTNWVIMASPPAPCAGSECTIAECCQETCALAFPATSDCPSTAFLTNDGPCLGGCTQYDCCQQTCSTGAIDFSGAPYVCDGGGSNTYGSNRVLNPTKLTDPCGDGPCDDDTCCMASNEYCQDYTCSDPSESVPTDSAYVQCDNGCDDDQCNCDTTEVTCREALYSCSSGSRIDTNTCDGASSTCTDADCCEPENPTTITESRMMRTPRSRMGQMQYGA